MTLEDKPIGLEGVQYATGEEWRAITNSSRKKEVTGQAEMMLSGGWIWW